MNVKIVVHEAEEGGFWAEVPALPGCVSQGETMDELLANVREAIQGWLDTGAARRRRARRTASGRRNQPVSPGSEGALG
jgi:predicted RNase H-like HicB family nuclease